MAKNTLHDRLCAGLLALGYKQEPSRSRYTTFSNPQKSGYLMFVGESGALRKGECAARSHSLQLPRSPFYDKALAAGDARLAAEKPQSAADRYA